MDPYLPKENDIVKATQWSEETQDGLVQTMTFAAIADKNWTDTDKPVRYEFWTKPAEKELTLVAMFSPIKELLYQGEPVYQYVKLEED